MLQLSLKIGKQLESYIELCKTSTMKLFAKTVNSFSRKLLLQRNPRQIFDWVLNISLAIGYTVKPCGDFVHPAYWTILTLFLLLLLLSTAREIHSLCLIVPNVNCHFHRFFFDAVLLLVCLVGFYFCEYLFKINLSKSLRSWYSVTNSFVPAVH